VTFGELFAGIGGFSLGLERAGMTCKWQVEIDPYARAVLNKHWPDVPKHDDVRTFPPTHTHTQDFSVDLICGGFPCQDISVAGKGAGLAGERSGLWNDFARIIRTVRPRWVVIENVPALTARGLGTVLGDLAEIGFDAEWHCIPASAVGAPHRRERIWIVGNARCEPIGGSIAASAVERGQAAAPASPVSTGDAGCGRTYARLSNVADSDCARLRHCGRSCTACETRAVQGKEQERQRLWVDAQPSRQGGDVPNANRAGRQQQRRPEPTPAEQLAAERSGWWESEPDVGRVAHGIPSRVDRLRCLGNAVVPQVVEVIGRAILAAEARMTS
jgi:DNA (cytosine-5)-methyltransferase 1